VWARFRAWFVRKTFRFWQSIGFNVTVAGFYSPIPEMSQLSAGHWKKPFEMLGVDMRAQEQRSFLQRVKKEVSEEFIALSAAASEDGFSFERGFFSPVDAEMYYSMICLHKPRVVIEIGAGNTTHLAAAALERNREEFGVIAELHAIEPYPNPSLKKGFSGLTSLIQKPVQEVSMEVFDLLQEGDILFIDSSHVMKAGSDVQHEFFKLLPRLPKGVFVHVHDIHFPYDYLKRWVMDEQKFWNEQYVLHAFLMFNNAFQVRWCSSYMHHLHSNELAHVIPSYDSKKHTPSSFWMQRVG
jgi:hypothetical protein